MPATIKDIREAFRRELSDFYEQRERDAIVDLTLTTVLENNKIDLMLNPGNEVAKDKLGQLYEILEKLKRQVPVQYAIGHTWFLDLKLKTDQRALIPRPETEELVLKIVARTAQPKPAILDIGTGSGAIALGLKSKMPNAEVYAVDVSAGALELAAENAANTGLTIHLSTLDILKNGLDILPVTQWDVLVSNPPYVTEAQKSQMLQNVVANEPHLALFVADDDPLIFYKIIVQQAQRFLKSNGLLFFEINEEYGNEIAQMLSDMKFKKVIIEKDLTGRDRFVSALK